MSEILVTGHRNPDLDAVCSAWGYAEFKNLIDPGNTYRAIRCGNLNEATRMVFEKAGIDPPPLVKDIQPRVRDVAKRDITTLDIDDPVFAAVRELDSRTISVIPVFENGNRFRGIISLHEISRFLISETSGKRPVYEFSTTNFPKVVPGYFLHRGETTGFRAPVMTGAMPYEISIERIRALGPDKPLLVIGLREDLIRYAVENQFPAIIITGMEEDRTLPVDTAGYTGTIYVSRADTAETIRLLRLSMPLKSIMNDKPLRLQSDDLFDDALETLLESSYRGLPVFEEDRFCGIVTRRCFIERPRRQLILIDHNEINQSVKGADEAEILEIVDHHRLAAGKTQKPIYIYARPVGSSCTLVVLHFKMAGIPIPRQAAGILLAGILSDTVVLKSPTVTETDRQAVEELSMLSGLSPEAYGREIFSHSTTLKQADADKLIRVDFKEYTEGKLKVGIGQVEVVTLDDASAARPAYVEKLEILARDKGLDWAMLLVTDVLTENSVLITSPFPEGEKRFIYTPLEPQLYDLPGILSRKKQLLPEILRIITDLGQKNRHH
jgi:manganese-dependent inorganic pyrophosphatase